MNIKISKNAHLCAACEVDFQHGQTLISTAKKWEGALHREDFCQACWPEERKKEAYSVWQVVYHDPKVESEEPPEVFSPLRQLFYEAAEEESRLEMAKAFLAAGLLRRQKVFRLIKESDEVEGSIRVTLYTDRIGNRLIEVPDPQFTYNELESARTQLIARLQELEAAAAQTDEAGTDEDERAGTAPKSAEAEAEMAQSTSESPVDAAPDGADPPTPDPASEEAPVASHSSERASDRGGKPEMETEEPDADSSDTTEDSGAEEAVHAEA